MIDEGNVIDPAGRRDLEMLEKKRKKKLMFSENTTGGVFEVHRCECCYGNEMRRMLNVFFY